MGSNFGLNLHKSDQSQRTDAGSSATTGGIKKETIDPKLHSVFDKADKDKNGILDDGEYANFKAEIDTNNDGNIDKSEIKNFIKNNNFTYINDKGKEKELSGEDLNLFFEDLAQYTEKSDVKSATKGNIDGKPAVTITKKDDSKEIIFDDKNEPTRLVTTDPQTGDSKTQFVKDCKVLKEVTESQNGDVTTTEFDDSGKPTYTTKVLKLSGENSVTNYTDGSATSKDVKKGTVTKHYSIDEDGNEILKNEVQDLGNGLEKISTHIYEDNKEIITINNPDGSQIVQTKIDDKLTQTVETKTGATITTKYNEDGTKLVTKEKNNVTTTTLLNTEEHRTEQTQIVNGQTYKAQYDGKGNTQIVVRAGDSLEQIADYMTRNSSKKVTVEDLKHLNPKINNDNIQAGQMITVPGEYDAASGIVLSRGTQAKQKAKGDAAEQELNDIVGNSNQIYEQKNTKGKYSSYKEYARELMQKEGISTDNKFLTNKYIKKIQEMNGNKPITELDSIKTPMTKELKEKTEAENKKIAEEKAKQTELKQAKANFRQIQNAYAEAKIEFDNHKKQENFTHWIADGVSRAWNNKIINLTGNTETQVREELEAYNKACNKMYAALEVEDMEEYKRLYKETFHQDYNGALPKDMNKIKDRVANYNDSQETGATVVEGTLKGTGAVLGGAGGAAFASVVVDSAKDLTTGVKNGNGEYNISKVKDNANGIYNHAGEKVLEYGFNAGINAGAAKLGQVAGEYIGGKVANRLASKINISEEHVLVGNMNNPEGMIVLSEEGTKILRQGLKYTGIGSTAGRYIADNVASDGVSLSGDAVQGVKMASSAGSAAGGIIADAGATGTKKIVKSVSKSIGRMFN